MSATTSTPDTAATAATSTPSTPTAAALRAADAIAAAIADTTAGADAGSSCKDDAAAAAAAAAAVAASDPLDAVGFDPVQYINIIFPTEQSLAKIDSVVDRLQAKALELEEDLSNLVRGQSDGAAEVASEILQVKAAIEELYERINMIREKAGSSEQMVQDITRDIKSLDQAKKNLVTSITTIKRLQMLASSLDYIKVLAQRRQYIETAQLLHVIIQLITYFEGFKNVAQIAVLFERVKQLEQDLRRQIFSDFEAGQVAGLESVARRFAWLKRLLKTHDEDHAAAFPPHKSIAEVLAATETTLDVKVMLAALQQSIEFEGKLSGRFELQQFTEQGEAPPPKFRGIISSCFESYLRLYIESEDKTISVMMDAYRQSTVMQEDDYVLQSSTDLFLFYRQTLVQCSKLSTNKPFLDLCRLFGKWLRVYADVLTSKLP
ncbi:Vacuolar protein sorting-associated protein 53, partial [Cladochytrium tenue]